MHVDAFKQKMIRTFFETLKRRPVKIYSKSEVDPNRPSKLELDFSSKLRENNIEFVSPFVYDGKRYDFYIPSLNSIVEIDGDAYHKDNLSELTLTTINGSRNDYNKNNIIDKSSYNFYRIRYAPAEFTFDDIPSLHNVINTSKYFPDYGIRYRQKIVDKAYFGRYISSRGKAKLQKYSPLILKFIRTFVPELPYPDLEESLSDVMYKLSKMDVSNPYDIETNEFSNNISTVGHNYLKHHFKSYWKSKFNGNLSPAEAWLDDKIMQAVIDYRIGCNNSGEIYDFSLHQLVRGLSARRITVSFFNPRLAGAIYKKYIGDKKSPMVLDPCCGFGGRLLGFKSQYPDGIYVGCEPNIETYNELVKLKESAGWSDAHVRLYNCKFEDFVDENFNYDMVFTSIPYYDIEIYSNNTEYNSFEEWRDTFIASIERYSGKNCYINLSGELCNRLGWDSKIHSHIKSNRSHFDKKDGCKREPIVRL